MQYNLHSDAACSYLWGEGTSESNLPTLVPVNHAPRTPDIFGRLPTRQFVSAGIHSNRMKTKQL
ncbi:spore coat protein U domain-containing protein [Thermosynechococcus sp. M3746_W2019_013]|uniref:Csu type fimbrial protein n=1 Tax=Thermosynechococcus sp. M3746_W2019_013 TaxID=2747806 RepID=UPI00345BEDE8